MSQSADQNHRLLKILFLVSFVTLLLAATGYRIGKDLAIRDQASAGQHQPGAIAGVQAGSVPPRLSLLPR